MSTLDLSKWSLSVVWLRDQQAGTELARPAAFVFGTPDGFAFVEPAYLDPDDSGRRFHRVHARVLEVELGGETVLAFDGEEWLGRIERYTASEAQREKVGDGLTRFAAYLQERKDRTVEEERERLRKHLAEDLA